VRWSRESLVVLAAVALAACGDDGRKTRTDVDAEQEAAEAVETEVVDDLAIDVIGDPAPEPAPELAVEVDLAPDAEPGEADAEHVAGEDDDEAVAIEPVDLPPPDGAFPDEAPPPDESTMESAPDEAVEDAQDDVLADPAFDQADAKDAGPLVWTVCLEESFEDEASGWTATGLWHRISGGQMPSDVWAAPPNEWVTLAEPWSLSPPKHGTHAFWYGRDEDGSFLRVDATEPPEQSAASGGTSWAAHQGTLTSPPIDLTGYLGARLSFWSWWEIESIHPTEYDLSTVEASGDGGASWTEVFRMNPPSDSGGGKPALPFTANGVGAPPSWALRKADLSAFAGKQVLVRFRFDTGDEYFNGFRGWMLDELKLECAQ
jgi:hypothetical protein